MKIRYKLLALFLTTFAGAGCSQQDSTRQLHIVELAARDEGIPAEKPIIYRMKVPSHWTQQQPSFDESITDTKKAIAEFFIEEKDEKIRIAIHNFPSDSMDSRIPPMVQVSRWKKQFSSMVPSSVSTKPHAFGGYYGFLFEATGEMHGIATTVLGWALQLAPEHYRSLSHPVPATLANRHRQMRGDVTIKAVGPEQLMDKYREEIISSARTFQLIDDIP